MTRGPYDDERNRPEDKRERSIHADPR
jgi:hypothetical protein